MALRLLQRRRRATTAPTDENEPPPHQLASSTQANATKECLIATRDKECANDDLAPWACPICYETMVDPAIGGGCSHHFCHACLQHWVNACSGTSCPSCRAPMLRVIRDPEFAQSIGAVSSVERTSRVSLRKEDECKSTEDESERVTRHVTVEWPAGITLALASSARRSKIMQIVVANVARGNGADRAGIHAGDVCVAVNGIRVTHPRVAIQLIDRFAILGTLELEILPSWEPVPPPVPSSAHLSSAYEDASGLHAASSIVSSSGSVANNDHGERTGRVLLARDHAGGAAEDNDLRPRSPRHQHRERAFATTGTVHEVASRRPPELLQQRRTRGNARGTSALEGGGPSRTSAIVHVDGWGRRVTTDDDDDTMVYLVHRPPRARYLPSLELGPSVEVAHNEYETEVMTVRDFLRTTQGELGRYAL